LAAVALARQLEQSDDLEAAQAARVQLWLGGSLVGLGQPADALAPLRRARALAEELGDPWSAVEAMDWEACALHLSDSPGAVALAESALVACRVLRPVPPPLEARILGHLGSFFVRRREWKRALAAYQDAVCAAARISDLRQLALMHHNLSIAHQRLGNQAAARREAERGLALYGAQSGRGDLARMQSDYGDLLRRQGDYAGARRELNNALDTFQAADEEHGIGYTLLTLAEVDLAEGQPDAAHRLLDRVRQLPGTSEQPLLCACSVEVEARLAAAAGDAAADAHFRAAIALFEEIDHRERAAEARIEYADLLEARGDLRAAIAELRKAADTSLPAALAAEGREAAPA
jgi:tetratricopeptide (TPR) repeat protein